MSRSAAAIGLLTLVLPLTAKAVEARDLTPEELVAVGETLRRCWSFDPGPDDNLKPVSVRLSFDPMARIQSAELVTASDPGASQRQRILESAALRAAINPTCSSLPIPHGVYNSIVVTFDPRGAGL